MTINEQRRQLNEYREELGTVHAERVRLEDREAALALIVSGLEKLVGQQGGAIFDSAPPDAVDVDDDQDDDGDPIRGPRGRNAVRALLNERGAMEFADIIAEIKHRGWIKSDAKNPDHSIRVTIDRMSKDAEIVYDEAGRVTLAQSSLPEPGGQI